MRDVTLFPPAARVIYLRNDDASDLSNYRGLMASERAQVSEAVDPRKGEFGDARWCAHQALLELGVHSKEAILRGERGMPLWPAGFTGSLTHTDGLRAAVAAPTRLVRSMGLDAEPAQRLPAGVLRQIARPSEIEAVGALQQQGHAWADRLLFCAKEATYKCWFPLTRRWLGFEEAEIEIRLDGTFVSHLLARPTPAPFFEGRWAVRSGYVIASAFYQ